MLEKNTTILKLRVLGIVQGVGFRPFIHTLAKKYDLKGWVLNDSNGVLIEVQGRIENLNKFKISILKDKPILSEIDNIIEQVVDDKNRIYDSFSIKNSENSNNMKTVIPYDSAICNDCLKELENIKDRRYEYPFINCTNCGPRYSIIKRMPYDRPCTTMDIFNMCSDCKQEYMDIGNRRYHAQPNACATCGPQLTLFCNKTKEEINNNILEECGKILNKGKILAVKSLTGFHLSIDASNIIAINRLRVKKRRDSKPFAIMVKNLSVAQKYAYISSEEGQLLQSEKRPIVILKKKLRENFFNDLAPHNPNIGIMLPSAPIHYLLLKYSKLEAIVMTSANISGEPIIYKNDEAIHKMKDISDFILLNNRDINTRLDDSIIKLTKFKNGKTAKIIIRRSRGYAPYSIKTNDLLDSLISVGSELKTTVSLSKDNEIFLSQYIGDLKNKESFLFHNELQEKLSMMYDINSKGYVYDMHPYFNSTKFNHHKDKKMYYVQHHHAHMAACMADNKMNNELVIGVIYDGTGFGMDNTIWGGEILIGNYANFRRVSKIRNFKLLGNDKAISEPFRIAISLLYNTFGDDAKNLNIDFIKNLTSLEKNVYFKMAKNNINTSSTSSMGRLFDGVSALFGICKKIEYEAQASIELEGLLSRDLHLVKPFKYGINKVNDLYEVDYAPMIEEIVLELSNDSINLQQLSRKFHSTVIDMTISVCLKISQEYNVNNVVLSGGVFMNEYLLSNIYTKLQECGLYPLIHNDTPANDGSISLGQLMIANYMKYEEGDKYGEKKIGK